MLRELTEKGFCMRTAGDVAAGVSALWGFGLMVWASLTGSSWAIWWGLVLLLGVPAVCAMIGEGDE